MKEFADINYIVNSNYQNLCRLCLKSTEMKLNLFCSEGIRRGLCQKILNCVSLIVSENDNLPKTVCHTCVDKLENFQDFRDACHETENLLHAYISSSRERTDISPAVTDPKRIEPSIEHNRKTTTINALPKEVAIKVKREPEDYSCVKRTNSNSCPQSPTKKVKVKLEPTEDTRRNLTCAAEKQIDNVDAPADFSYSNRKGCTVLPFITSKGEHVYSHPGEVHNHKTSTIADKRIVNSCEILQNQSSQEEISTQNLQITAVQRAVVKNRQKDVNEVPSQVNSTTVRENLQNEMSSNNMGLNNDCLKRLKLPQVTKETATVNMLPSAVKLFLQEHDIYLNKSLQDVRDLTWKKHNCPQCSKCFLQKVDLTRHLRTHTGERPYVCSVCFKRFAQKGNCDRHSKRHLIC